jgi:hypothetical protein
MNIPLIALGLLGYGIYEYVEGGKPKKSAPIVPASLPIVNPTTPKVVAITPKVVASTPKTAPITDKPAVAPHLTSVPTVNVPATGNSVPGSSTVPAATNAAVVMNTALASHGYKKSDQNLYKAFQTSVNLKADGLPGPNTMNALQTALGALGVTMAPVHVYPFSAFDGVGGPSSAEWNGKALPNKATTPITSTGNIPTVHPNVTVTDVAANVPGPSGPTQDGGTLS